MILQRERNRMGLWRGRQKRGLKIRARSIIDVFRFMVRAEKHLARTLGSNKGNAFHNALPGGKRKPSWLQYKGPIRRFSSLILDRRWRQ